MDAKVDIRKLQFLNDRISQVTDALNQVRLSVHGLQQQPQLGFPPSQMGYPQSPLGFQPPPFGFQHSPYAGMSGLSPFGQADRAARDGSEPDPADVPALPRPDYADSVVGARAGK